MALAKLCHLTKLNENSSFQIPNIACGFNRRKRCEKKTSQWLKPLAIFIEIKKQVQLPLVLTGGKSELNILGFSQTLSFG
ncbi:hypothetical protein ACQ9BO_26685 [Flavobacterium sp. P21]|uniref:hypothetical protein n=1 Tax=Flavobacterium sp. P21 TaxID=3423948 RepID=UPI003D67B4AE